MSVLCCRKFNIRVLNATPTFDFTYTLTPCTDGGSPYDLHIQSTVDPGGVYTWEVYNPTTSSWIMLLGGTSSVNVSIPGAAISDVATQIKGRYFPSTGVIEVIKPITIPHLPLPNTFTVQPFTFVPAWMPWSAAILNQDMGNPIGAWDGFSTSPETPGAVYFVLGFYSTPVPFSWGYAQEIHFLSSIGGYLYGKYNKAGCNYPTGTWTLFYNGDPGGPFEPPATLTVT